MLKKISALLMIFSVSIFALPVVNTNLDSVVVPVKVIAGSGTNWTGKVNYWLRVGDNDSLNISLQINPVGAAPACNITSTDGDVGTIQWANGINGKREIFFNCSFATAPIATDMYTATVTIMADQSNLEKTARNVLAGIPNNLKCAMLAGTRCFATWDVTGVTAPSPYATVAGFHMCDGPLGINMRDPNHVKCATLYPTESASSCAFDTSLSNRIGKAIANEARTALPSCGTNQNQNVNLAPMLNMVRDPRDGRAFETFGEDPFLTAKLATWDTKGRQSENVIATPKHFVCNDQELNRETSTSNVDDITLHQSYAYPFEMVVREAKPWGLMAAYNKLNGTLCTEDTTLLTGIARQEWGFRGFIVSDWFTWMKNPAIYSGLDIEMDWVNIFGNMCDGSVPQDVIDQKVLNELRGKIWTGCVADFSAFNGTSSINSPEHITLANEGAHKSLVLAKNDSILVGGVRQAPLLPLNKNTVTTVAVVGPYANRMRIGAECDGTSARVDPCVPQIVTPLKAIQDKIGAAKVVTDWTLASVNVVIVFVGIPATGNNAACEAQDRPDVVLPVSEDGTNQDLLVQNILAAGKKTIVVLTGGAAVSQGAWSNASSVIVAFYPGQGQGAAIADVLFGDYNPSGKLSVSFPKTVADLPPFTAEGAAAKAYQYEGPSDGKGYSYYLKTGKTPLFWFGWGLHYSTYTYSNLVVPRCAAIGSKIQVTVDVKNNGPMAGDEIVQLYLSQKTPVALRPIKQLRGFARVSLLPTDPAKTVTFDLREWDFAHWKTGSGWTVDPNSTYEISVGKYSNDPGALISTITMDPASGVCQ